MNNFTFCVPTRIHFGKGQISHLSELAESGSNVLLVYGGGSIKKSGLYDEAMAILSDAGLHVVELSGIEPNPRIESVREGARLCKEHAIDMVLAVGGGSVIDAAKVIAGAAKYDGDAWTWCSIARKSRPRCRYIRCLPLLLRAPRWTRLPLFPI